MATKSTKFLLKSNKCNHINTFFKITNHKTVQLICSLANLHIFSEKVSVKPRLPVYHFDFMWLTLL